jgi:hypothetical protein
MSDVFIPILKLNRLTALRWSLLQLSMAFIQMNGI